HDTQSLGGGSGDGPCLRALPDRRSRGRSDLLLRRHLRIRHAAGLRARETLRWMADGRARTHGMADSGGGGPRMPGPVPGERAIATSPRPGRRTVRLPGGARGAAPGSRRSSLGLCRTEDVYVGEHGESLRLSGLEPGINDRAMERAIVMHGAPYVSRAVIAARGELGRSWGCPALEPGVERRVIERIKGGTALFAYYPNSHWLGTSRFLRCEERAGT